MKDSVTINYRVKKDTCHCCGNRLENAVLSDCREFVFYKDNVLDYNSNWKLASEIDEDFQKCIEEYVYETIYFYAVNPDDRVMLDHSELKKVKEFIRERVMDDV